MLDDLQEHYAIIGTVPRLLRGGNKREGKFPFADRHTCAAQLDTLHVRKTTFVA